VGEEMPGRTIYLGRIADDPHCVAAQTKWNAERVYYTSCVPVPTTTEGFTVRDLANEFLASKQNLVDSGEITQRTWNDYHATCERIINQFGKPRRVDSLAPLDFEKLRAALGKTWGPVAVGNEVNRIRVNAPRSGVRR
jgi:hypothetical protein